MKKLYLFILLFSAWFYSNATIHTVLVADFNFIPASVNAVCGDTVAWVWSSGTHTTTSTSVPSCATSWNAPITSALSTYAIVILPLVPRVFKTHPFPVHCWHPILLMKLFL